MAGTGERRRAWTVCAIAAVAVVVLCASPFASALRDTPGRTHINDNRGRFVRIPASVPHTPGAYIDKRIRRNLIWLADAFRIYVTEGFAGRLPNGDRVGCPKSNRDQTNQSAVNRKEPEVAPPPAGTIHRVEPEPTR